MGWDRKEVRLGVVSHAMFARVDYSAGLIGCLGGPFFLPLLRSPKRSPFHERKRSFLEAIVAVLPC